jgi:hypothetical protein
MKGLDGIEETKYEDKMEVDASVQPFPECGGCEGKRYVDHGRGWERCLYCADPVPSYGGSSSYAAGSVSSSARNDRSGYYWDSQTSSWQ